MSSRQSRLQQDTTFRIMTILSKNPDLTQRELADRVGISVGGVNYCLKALMEKGLVGDRRALSSAWNSVPRIPIL